MVTKTLTAGSNGRIVDQSAFDKAQAGLQQIKDFLDAKLTKWNGVQPLTEEETRNRQSDFHRAYSEQFNGAIEENHGQGLHQRARIQTPLPKLVQHYINKTLFVKLKEKLVGMQTLISKRENRIKDFSAGNALALDQKSTTHDKLNAVLDWLDTLVLQVGGNNSHTKRQFAEAAKTSSNLTELIDNKRVQPAMHQASPTTDEAINLGWAKLNHFASDSLQFMPKIDTED